MTTAIRSPIGATALAIGIGLAAPSGAQNLPGIPGDLADGLAGCTGPADDAEPGTLAWQLRDLANVACGSQRLLDAAVHPNLVLPLSMPLGDPYRAPARRDGVRFRYHATTVTNRNGVALDVEIYRPCAPGTCSGIPEELQSFEPPYPGILIQHGGFQARKELHWWATQSLAEAGYMTVALNAIHEVDAFFEDSGDVLDWFLATPDAPDSHGEHNPFWMDLDHTRIGMAGHSGGGATANRHGNEDPRVSVVVGWDRSGRYPLPEDLNVPSLYLIADYGFTPQPMPSPPNPDGFEEGTVNPGNRFEDFERHRAQGNDTMRIVLRAATHLDWVPMAVVASRYGEAVSLYYTLAWFDRYLRGRDDPVLAQDAFARLTAPVFDGSADRHNISQGFWDPVQALLSGDPLFGGNVPYRLEGMPVSDRLSFYFFSKCDIAAPGGGRARSQDMRNEDCTLDAGADSGSGVIRGGMLLGLLLASVLLRNRRRATQVLSTFPFCGRFQPL